MLGAPMLPVWAPQLPYTRTLRAPLPWSPAPRFAPPPDLPSGLPHSRAAQKLHAARDRAWRKELNQKHMQERQAAPALLAKESLFLLLPCNFSMLLDCEIYGGNAHR